MPPLPPETLPTVSYFSFWIFNIAIPNLIIIIVLVLVFILALWLKIPKWFEG